MPIANVHTLQARNSQGHAFVNANSNTAFPPCQNADAVRHEESKELGDEKEVVRMHWGGLAFLSLRQGLAAEYAPDAKSPYLGLKQPWLFCFELLQELDPWAAGFVSPCFPFPYGANSHPEDPGGVLLTPSSDPPLLSEPLAKAARLTHER